MNLIINNWNEEKYKEYLSYLNILSDKEVSEFNKKIMNDERNILGIKIPVLRNVAKEILKGDAESFLNISENKNGTFEETLVEGIVIASIKEGINDKISRIDKFLPKITSWAICDSFIPSLKCVNKNKEIFWNYLVKKFNESNDEFELRFVIVSIKAYYIENEKLDEIFNMFSNISCDKYYVKMALAWTLCDMYIKYSKETYSYLTGNNNLDDFTFNKTIDKCRDSYRVSVEDKEKLKKLKR